MTYEERERERELYGLIRFGFGNQMSEIATYYIISKISGRQLFFDRKVVSKSHSYSHDGAIYRILKENFKEGFCPSDKYYLEFNNHQLKCVINFLKNGGFADKPTLLNGLMHDFSTFWQHKNDIFHLFEELIPKKIVEERIAFHFRLGDFLHYCPDKVISDKYIHGAILGMLEQGAPREIDCFTENPVLAQERIMRALEMEPKIYDIKINFIHGDDLEDFKSMAGYKYFISSWSSYSWWSLFLGASLNKDRIVSVTGKNIFRFYENQFVPKMN